MQGTMIDNFANRILQNITDITERHRKFSHITLSPMVLTDKQQNHADIVKMKQSSSTT